MKYSRVIFTSVVTILTFLSVVYTSCTKSTIEYNACASMQCQNGGVCEEGFCNCPPDYTGVYCETKIEPCKDIVCLNGGNCVNGDCICAAGYEGKKCEDEIRTKFLGEWKGLNYCDNSLFDINMTIIENKDSVLVVIINNPAGIDKNPAVTGKLVGQEIIFSDHEVSAGLYISGKLTYTPVSPGVSEPHIVLDFTMKTDQGNSKDCQAIYTKE